MYIYKLTKCIKYILIYKRNDKCVYIKICTYIWVYKTMEYENNKIHIKVSIYICWKIKESMYVQIKV